MRRGREKTRHSRKHRNGGNNKKEKGSKGGRKAQRRAGHQIQLDSILRGNSGHHRTGTRNTGSQDKTPKEKPKKPRDPTKAARRARRKERKAARKAERERLKALCAAQQEQLEAVPEQVRGCFDTDLLGQPVIAGLRIGMEPVPEEVQPSS